MTIMGVSLMNLVLWVILGFVVGIIVHKFDPGDAKGGVFATTLLGIAGAILGGFLSFVIFHVPVNAFSFQGFVTALVGAFILAFIHRLFLRGHNNIKTSRTQLR